MTLNRLRAALALIAAALAFAPVVRADNFPTRPITIVVPFAAGGATDLSARKIAELLSRQLGQAVIVDNKPGAGGLIGLSAVARAAPDGYTLGWGGNSPLTIAPYLAKKAPYDPERAFLPVSLACVSSFTYTARKGLGVKTLPELVARARKEPGKITFASSGVGTSTHMLGELLKSTAQVDLLHVPYKGETEGFQAMLSDQVDVMATSTPGVLTQLQGGRILGLATTASSRVRSAPEVPTVSEAGYPGLQLELFFGLIAPAGTPSPVVERLNAEMRKAVADPSFAEAMQKAGFEASSSSAKEFAALIARHSQQWRGVIAKNRISVD